jgi:EKC/KEOPS complex subunit CGI121/TPRKB
MESYHLPQFPSSYSSIHIALFKDVKNSASLRKRLVAASTMEGSEGDQERDKLDYAFIEGNMVSQLKQPGGPLIKQESASPRKIVNRDQLLTAIYSALQAASTETLKTKTIHSEVLLSLHPSSNVSILKFGDGLMDPD